MLQNSPIKVIGTTREDCAGYAADAYARVNGIGAVCVTYCVGGLSVSNSIAGAYAEKSPVVVLTGSPGMKERINDPMLHHKVRHFSTQKEIFEKITAASVVLDDPEIAFRQIDETLAACMRLKRPVYIELPRDMVDVVPRFPNQITKITEVSNRHALKEALSETVALLNRAKKPVILADVEVHRYGLSKELVQLVNKTGLPVAATILGKSVISEKHPQYLGVYEGAMGHSEVQKAVETSDCLLMLGTFMTDMNLGVYTANLDQSRAIEATSEKIQISHHRYTDILLKDYVQGLLKSPIRKRKITLKKPRASKAPLKATRKPMTVRYLFSRVNEFLEDDMAVVSDVGDCLFGSIDLVIHRKTEFLAPAYYTSMGFGVPAGLGAQVANPKLRSLIIVGDGAFQMTGTELSTIGRLGLNPIILLLNNHGYTTERLILEGPFNDIAEWSYENMPQLVGNGWGCSVRTEIEFDQSLKAALKNKRSFSLLNIFLDKMDHSPALSRLGANLAAKLGKKNKK